MPVAIGMAKHEERDGTRWAVRLDTHTAARSRRAGGHLAGAHPSGVHRTEPLFDQPS